MVITVWTAAVGISAMCCKSVITIIVSSRYQHPAKCMPALCVLWELHAN